MSKRPSRLRRTTVIAVLTIVLAAILIPVSSALASGSAADATNGQTLFQSNCAMCHGANAAGGLKVGSTTAPDIRWSAIGADFKDPALVRRAILNGQDEEGKALDSAMPRFSDKLTQSQADDIVAYLQTLTTGLPKTGEPVDGQALPWIALAAAVIALGGLKLRQVAR